MNRKSRLKKYLEDTPPARERKNKVRCISNLMRKTHPALQSLSSEVMDTITDEIIAYERYWKKILLDNPELRGGDYKTKKISVKNKLIHLGYKAKT